MSSPVAPRLALALLGASLLAIPARAQSPTDSTLYVRKAGVTLLRVNADGKVGIGTDAPSVRLQVDSGGVIFNSPDGFLSNGSPTGGLIPIEGQGVRMMWYPGKAAFRAGAVSSTEWDDVNIGPLSWAGGQQVVAAGQGSFAYGQGVVIAPSGLASTAFGAGTLVSGPGGFSAGINNRCTGQGCVALGITSHAGGKGSVAIGFRASATSNYAVSIGYRVSNISSSGNPKIGAVVIGATDLPAVDDSTRAQHNGEFRLRAPGGIYLRTSNASNADVGVDANTGCDIPAGSGTMTCVSSRTLKEHFADVSGEDVLRRVRALPVTTWNYIAEGPRARHMGPVAEDFHEAFGLGVTDKGVGLQDIDGVNLAAVKALEARSAAQATELAALRAELHSAKVENAALAARLARIEAVLASAPR